jgi:hypothetical protein
VVQTIIFVAPSWSITIFFACYMRSCLPRIGIVQLNCRKRFKISGMAKNGTRKLGRATSRDKLMAFLMRRPIPQIGAKGQNSFILIVCPAQTILSRSSTSQCPSALFNLTAAAVPRCTVFAHE